MLYSVYALLYYKTIPTLLDCTILLDFFLFNFLKPIIPPLKTVILWYFFALISIFDINIKTPVPFNRQMTQFKFSHVLILIIFNIY